MYVAGGTGVGLMLLGIVDVFVGVGRKIRKRYFDSLVQTYIPNKKFHIWRDGELMKPTHLVWQLGNVSLARSLSNLMSEILVKAIKCMLDFFLTISLDC